MNNHHLFEFSIALSVLPILPSQLASQSVLFLPRVYSFPPYFVDNKQYDYNSCADKVDDESDHKVGVGLPVYLVDSGILAPVFKRIDEGQEGGSDLHINDHLDEFDYACLRYLFIDSG